MTVATTPPLDYRYALDAVMPAYARASGASVLCNIPELSAELDYRGIRVGSAGSATTALWIEPLIDSWSAELDSLAAQLAAGGRLYVIASRPLAAVLPERRGWHGQPLGVRPGGLRRLQSSVRGRGFRITACYGIHGPASIGLNCLAWVASAAGRPDVGDRLQFAGRLRYCTRGLRSALSAVSLIAAVKEGEG